MKRRILVALLALLPAFGIVTSCMDYGARAPEKIGADGYSRTADLAVKMADRLMAAAPQSGLISEV